MFLLRLGARRQVTHLLRNNLNSTEIFGLLFGVKSFPHGDTLDKVFRCLDPQQFQEVVQEEWQAMQMKTFQIRFDSS